MDFPVQITFRDTPASPAVESVIQLRVQKLVQFYDRMTSCRVSIDAPRRHRHGGLFRVLIKIEVPEGEVVVGRDPAEAHEHEDVYVAIRDAFDAARRGLEDHARRYRGRGEPAQPAHHGRIGRLFPEERYGFIAAVDGGEIYFHYNSVSGGLERLELGCDVHFHVTEGEGEKGPQASSVHLAHKHQHPESPNR